MTGYIIKIFITFKKYVFSGRYMFKIHYCWNKFIQEINLFYFTNIFGQQLFFKYICILTFENAARRNILTHYFVKKKCNQSNIFGHSCVSILHKRVHLDIHSSKKINNCYTLGHGHSLRQHSGF